MFRQVQDIVGKTELGTSALVVTELLLGVYRGTPEVRLRRREFIDHMIRGVLVYPYSLDIAELAGRLGGQQAALGQTIPPIDLMIGATALSLGFSLLTTNVRHFRMIPGLNVIPF